MEIKTFEEDVSKIISSDQSTSIPASIEITFHTPVGDLEILDVVSLDTMSDYFNSFTDVITLEFLTGLGTFIHRLLPHKEMLEVSIVEVSNGIKYKNRYRLYISNNLDINANGIYDGRSEDELNKESLLRMTAQCVNRTAEALLATSITGKSIFKQVTVKEVILGLLANKLKEIKTNGQELDVVINMTEPDNDGVYRHIDVPSRTKVIDLISFIQDERYGVYNGDIGFYINTMKGRDVISIFPMHHNRDKNIDDMKLLVFKNGTILPEVSGSNSTLEDNVLKIVTGSETSSKDKGSVDMNNLGVGYTMVDPYLPMLRPVDVTDTSVTVSSDEINIREALKHKEDGVNKYNHLPSTINEFKLRSGYLRTNTVSMQIKWVGSKPNLLHPGFTGTIFSEEKGEVIKRLFTVSHVATTVNVDQDTVNSIVSILIEREELS